MLSANSQLYFAVLLTAFSQTQAEVNHKTLGLSHNHDDTLVNYGFGNETQCSWNCTVVDYDLKGDMKNTMAKNRVIRLIVKYEKTVDDQCVNQTYLNSSGNTTEHWKIWLANKQLSSIAKATERLMNLVFYSDSNAEHNEVRAMCVLKRARTTATTKIYNSSIPLSIFSRGHLADLGSEFNITDCNSEGMDNLQFCVNISKSTGNSSSTNLKSPFERGGWPVTVLNCLCSVFFLVFVYYSPAFLCLLSATEVKEDGVRQIILEGASPVSFRSLMGNCFFSGDDGTIWHKARTFTLFVVVFPGLFLPPAIALEKNYLWEGINLLPNCGGFGKLHLFHPFHLVCYACYVFQAIDLSFFTVKSSDGKTCKVCQLIQPKIYICRDQELPGRIMHHLRQQPLLLLKCWRLFLRYLVNYCRMWLSVILSCKTYVSSFLSICLFPIFLLSIPLIAIMLLAVLSLVACVGLLFTCPMNTIRDVTRGRRDLYHKSCSTLFTIFLRCCCLLPAYWAQYVVFSFTAIAIMKNLFWAITLLFSEESLPYLACFILVFYYVWSSYSSFTSKYQFLVLTLYKHHKKLPVVTDQDTQQKVSTGTLMRITKELFDVACEQLMPIRVSVCILVLRVALILAFVFLVFILTMLHHVSVTPVTGALVTFLSGLLPKIIDIFSDGGKKNIETTAIDEKVPYIIEDYYNNRATEQNIEIVTAM